MARPWERNFLGYTSTATFTAHRECRRRIALESVQRLTGRVRELLRAGRGRSLIDTIETLNPLLRGWIGYFRLTESKRVLEEVDGGVRRRLRCLLWRQWKRPRTRMRKLCALGIDPARARRSAGNGHGPWWNAGAIIEPSPRSSSRQLPSLASVLTSGRTQPVGDGARHRQWGKPRAPDLASQCSKASTRWAGCRDRHALPRAAGRTSA